jgi:phosphotransferase system  glucose/maltose/N-acetylglucosamine-specific IIC component
MINVSTLRKRFDTIDALKDLKLFFSNKRDIMLTFAVPIVLITLFALVFGEVGRTNRDNLLGLTQSVADTAFMMLLFIV